MNWSSASSNALNCCLVSALKTSKRSSINCIVTFDQPIIAYFFNCRSSIPYIKKIIKEYEDLYQIVQETLRPIGNLFERGIPEDEISF